MNHLKFGKLEIDPKKIHESTQVEVTMEKYSGLLNESHDGTPFLLPRIEAIHAGRTRNNTRYLRDKLRGDAELKSGVYSWLQPYAKPVIYNHDVETKATGRIYTAAFTEYTQAGRPGIIVVPKITDPEAIEGIQGGRLLTVSIGAETDSVTCSICGTDIINEGYCGHMKGETYDGVTAEWIAGNLWFDELSWVNVPADPDAMIVDTQSSVLIGTGSTESKSGIITLGNKSFSKQELVGITKESADDIVLTRGELVMTEKEIQALVEELETLKREKTTLEEAIATEKQSTDALKEEKETLSKEKETLAEEKETLVQENTSLKEEKEILTDAQEKVVTEMDELKSSTTSLQEELESLKSELEEKTSVVEGLETEKAGLQEQIETLKSNLEESQLTQEELVMAVKESHADHLASVRVLTGEEDTYATAKEALAESEIDSLKEAVSQIADTIEKFIENKDDAMVLRGQVTFGEGVERQEESKEELTEEKVFYNLLTGNNL